jgi:hypothetical protein
VTNNPLLVPYNPLEEFPCWVCFAPEAARMRFDRRGKPYVVCEACGMRVFCKSLKHVRGIYVTTSLVQAMLAQLRGDPAAAAERERQANEFAASIRARVQAVIPPSPPYGLEDLPKEGLPDGVVSITGK